MSRSASTGPSEPESPSVLAPSPAAPTAAAGGCHHNAEGSRCIAIYVPEHLQDDVELYLKSRFDVRTLGHSPRRSVSPGRGGSEDRLSGAARQLLSSTPPRQASRQRRAPNEAVAAARTSGGKGDDSGVAASLRRPLSAARQRGRDTNPQHAAVGNGRALLQMSPGPRSRNGQSAHVGGPQKHGSCDSNGYHHQERRRSSPRGSRDDLWRRLSTPTRRDSADAAARERTSSASRRPSSSARSSTPEAHRRTSTPDPEVYNRLYRLGLSSIRRREVDCAEAKVRHERETVANMLLARAKQRVLGQSDNFGLSEEQLNEEAMRHLKSPRLGPDEESDLAQRLSIPKKPAVSQQPEEHYSFHPTLSTSHEDHTPQEIDEHFQYLYLDARKQHRRHEELCSRVHKQHHMKILKERMAADFHFRRRVEKDPAVGDRFLASLE